MSAVVIGIGLTGQACLRYLLERGESVIAMDTRPSLPQFDALELEYVNIPFVLGDIADSQLLQADQIIVSPGFPLEHPSLLKAKALGIPIIGDIELFAREVDVPIVAITGSNGKSTVTTLVAHLLHAMGKRVGLGGNIGIPALDLLKQDKPDFYVLELSSFQLESTFSLHPFVASILNVTPDHLDRHHTFERYAAAKKRIHNHAQHVIGNLEDALTLSETHQPIYFTTQTPKTNTWGLIKDKHRVYLAYEDHIIMDCAELKLAGFHNYANVLAALAMVDCCLDKAISSEKVNKTALLDALTTFTGLSHRCERVAHYNQVHWINDSKATNIGATDAAITGLTQEKNVLLIAGGDAKSADLTDLLPTLKRYVKCVFLYGKDAEQLHAMWNQAVSCHLVDNLQSAVEHASEQAKKGDLVLLSPACSSLDQFQNFEERGHCFTQYVADWIQRQGAPGE